MMTCSRIGGRGSRTYFATARSMSPSLTCAFSLTNSHIYPFLSSSLSLCRRSQMCLSSQANKCRARAKFRGQCRTKWCDNYPVVIEPKLILSTSLSPLFYLSPPLSLFFLLFSLDSFTHTHDAHTQRRRCQKQVYTTTRPQQVPRWLSSVRAPSVCARVLFVCLRGLRGDRYFPPLCNLHF
jgi:hypothetical protein